MHINDVQSINCCAVTPRICSHVCIRVVLLKIRANNFEFANGIIKPDIIGNFSALCLCAK